MRTEEVGEPMTRYESDWKLVNDFICELQEEGFMINGTRNMPNTLFEQIEWHSLDQLKEKLESIRSIENFDSLNRIDSKGKKINQKYKKYAIKEIRALFNDEIVKVAGLIPQNSSATPHSDDQVTQ